MNKKQKYIFQVIMSVILMSFVLLLTIRYAIKSPPIIKLLALSLNALTAFYVYKTINNKNNKQ